MTEQDYADHETVILRAAANILRKRGDVADPNYAERCATFASGELLHYLHLIESHADLGAYEPTS